MRTTLNLDDQLIDAARHRAVENRVSLAYSHVEFFSHGVAMPLNSPRKSTQSGIESYPPRLLQVAQG